MSAASGFAAVYFMHLLICIGVLFKGGDIKGCSCSFSTGTCSHVGKISLQSHGSIIY